MLPATNTEQAVIQQFGTFQLEISPKKSIDACFEAINAREVDFAIVPFENSTNGQVVFTYDLLRDWFFDNDKDCHFQIVGEQFVSIHHNLLSNVPVDKIKTIYSHPQVWTQVKSFLKKLGPDVIKVDVGSTSQAAELVSQSKEQNVAAISSLMSAKLYNLPIEEFGIEDKSDNTTRFLILGYSKPPEQILEKGAEKQENTESEKKGSTSYGRITSLMFTLPGDNPGALCDVLVKFKEHGINLVSINSRPANMQAWQYVFFVESSEIEDPLILKDIENSCLTLVNLGTFNRNWRYATKLEETRK